MKRMVILLIGVFYFLGLLVSCALLGQEQEIIM